MVPMRLIHLAGLMIWHETHFKEDVADEIYGQTSKVLIPGCGKSSIRYIPIENRTGKAYSYANLSPNLQRAHWQLRCCQHSNRTVRLAEITIAAVQEREKIQ